MKGFVRLPCLLNLCNNKRTKANILVSGRIFYFIQRLNQCKYINMEISVNRLIFMESWIGTR